MTISSVCLIFIWLLPLTASSTVTSGQSNNFTEVMTRTPVPQNKFTHDQLTTREVSSLHPLFIADVNPTEEKATKASTESPLLAALTTPSETFLSGIQTAATPTNPTWSQLNSSTAGMKSTTERQPKVSTSETTAVTSHDSIPTTPRRTPSMPSSSTQKQFTSNKMTRPSTRPTQSTDLISTTTTSTTPAENTSTSTHPVRGGDTTQSTGLYKTSVATTKTPFIHITKAKERREPPEKKSSNGANHSKAVAGLIGGALVLMMVGFLVIYMKKQKLQRQQITTRDWAGPSPFLEGGADNGQVTLRSSNRITLSSFLPQRLSKRLSLLPETEEELEDMTPGTTFGNKHQGSTFGTISIWDGNDAEESNGTAVAVPEMKSRDDAPKTVESSVSVTSAQTDDPPHTNHNSEVANQSQDNSANPPSPSETE